VRAKNIKLYNLRADDEIISTMYENTTIKNAVYKTGSGGHMAANTNDFVMISLGSTKDFAKKEKLCSTCRASL